MDHTFDTKIFILDESLQGQQLQSMKLRHPGSEKATQFLLSTSKNTIYELTVFKEKHRSWFIDDSVASNGLIYIPMPFDPLYMVLGYLIKCDPKRVEPFEHVLQDEEFPDVKQFMPVVDMKDVSKIADQVGPDDLNAFKYNEEKTLEWLKKKCLMVVEALKKSNVRTGQNVTSQTFVNVSDGPADENACLLTAHGIVSEYISLELSNKLSTFMNIIVEPKNSAKRKSLVDLENSTNKKSRLSDIDMKMEKIPETKDDKKAKQKNEKLAKAATGSKNIMAFFGKK